MSARPKRRGEWRGISACIKISHRGRDIEFHKDEEIRKHFRPGAGEGEAKQPGVEEKDSNDKSQRAPGE